MEGHINKNQWREILLSKLPGEKAQLLMAPTLRGGSHNGSKPIHAAVLILMYPTGGETNIVFIKRNAYNGPHSAQVSLPGGAWEARDGSLENTALRETREELGITDEIEILGAITELHIPVSNFLVSPYVGCMNRTPLFHPDVSEVQYVIETPLMELLDPQNVNSETLLNQGLTIEVPFYRIGDEKIWGATAMMLCEFLQLASILQ